MISAHYKSHPLLCKWRYSACLSLFRIFTSTPSQNRYQSRTILRASINSDLDKKNNWDDQNSVYFEVRKTLLLPILPSMIPCLYNITSMLYRRIRYNIETFVGTTYFYYSKVFLKVRKFVQMCKGLIRQCMGFCSHIWGYSPNTHLDRIQS